jgi:hypothetical protein
MQYNIQTIGNLWSTLCYLKIALFCEHEYYTEEYEYLTTSHAAAPFGDIVVLSYLTAHRTSHRSPVAKFIDRDWGIYLTLASELPMESDSGLLVFTFVNRFSSSGLHGVPGQTSTYVGQCWTWPQRKRFIHWLLAWYDFLPCVAGSRQVTRLEAESYVPDRLWYCPPSAAKLVIKKKHQLRPGTADLHFLVGSWRLGRIAYVLITKYVHIKSTTVYAPRRNWDSPQPPTRRLVCPLPPVSGGRGTLARNGLGESQFRRGAYTVVLFICTYFVVLINILEYTDAAHLQHRSPDAVMIQLMFSPHILGYSDIAQLQRRSSDAAIELVLRCCVYWPHRLGWREKVLYRWKRLCSSHDGVPWGKVKDTCRQETV